MGIFQNPSTTSQGKNEEFYLQVARNHIPNHQHIHSFGAVEDLTTNHTGTLWGIKDTVYPWSAWDTAGTITLTRDSTSDANKVVTIQGLNADYAYTTENITLTSNTGNAGTVSWKRINGMYMTNLINVDHIYALKGNTQVAVISPLKSQSLMAIYTIPANKTGYLMKGSMSAKTGADAEGQMMVRYFGSDVFRIGHAFEVTGTGGQYTYEFPIPTVIPEKSDIDVRANTHTNNGRYTAAFDILIIDN
jgi:hypothetical protein